MGEREEYSKLFTLWITTMVLIWKDNNYIKHKQFIPLYSHNSLSNFITFRKQRNFFYCCCYYTIITTAAAVAIAVDDVVMKEEKRQVEILKLEFHWNDYIKASHKLSYINEREYTTQHVFILRLTHNDDGLGYGNVKRRSVCERTFFMHFLWLFI
jgi:hypothetical protein